MPNLPPAIEQLALTHQRAILELVDNGSLDQQHLRKQLTLALSKAAPGSYKANKLKIARILSAVASKTVAAWTAEALNEAIPEAIIQANVDGLDELDAWARANGGSLPPVAVRPALKAINDALIDNVPGSVARYEASTRSKVRRLISSGFLDTVSTIDDVVGGVNDVLKTDRWRAERIVRTEVMNAYNLSKHEFLLESKKNGLAPDVMKTCIITRDNRTARDSFPLEGQVRGLTEPFVDGAGRSYQHPPGRPNDREVEVPWLPDFDPPRKAPAELLDGLTSEEAAAEVSEAVAATLSDAAGLDEPLTPAPLSDGLMARLRERDEAVAASSAARTEQAQLDALRPWPADAGDLEVVRQLGGSTGAELVRGPDGALYVRKRGNSPGHLEEEATADALYQRLGVPVPDFRVYRDDNNKAKYKLSRYIEGKSLADIQGNPELFASVKAKLAEHFHVDALLGNWDVIGLSADNILVDASGTPYRIDNGGALRYRAQGALKRPELWSSGGCVDFWTMRDPKINPQAARVFDGVSFDDALERAGVAWLIEDEGNGPMFGDWGREDGVKLPAELAATLRRRLDDLEHAANQNAAMRIDDVRPAYREAVTLEVQRLRAAGISQRLPGQLTPDKLSNGDYSPDRVRDEKGANFDDLRQFGLIASVKDHINESGGSWEIVKEYTNSQGGSSWSAPSRAIKYWWNNEVVDRGNPDDAYFWAGQSYKTGGELWEAFTEEKGADVVRKGLTMFHAMTLEILHHVKLPPELSNGDGTFNLIRTEADFIPQTYFPSNKVGDIIPPYKRGAMESTSAFVGTYAYQASKHRLKFLNVPAHRILGTYLLGWGRQYGANDDTYLADDENEFTADLYGISAKWEADERPR